MDHMHIVAIPGSGKTRTIIAKVKAMLQNGISGIYIVTYTNAAAKEIMERLLHECGEGVLQIVTVSTFHSLMIRHIQRFMPQYKLMSPEEQSTLLHDVYVKHTETHEGFSEFETYSESVPSIKIAIYEEILERYYETLKHQGTHTLSNVVSAGYSLMLNRQLPAFPCAFMIVDEYQDVDQEQAKLVILHGKMGITIMTVGDDDQSIYGFRNALGYKAFEMQSDKLNSKEFQLTVNYRSKSEILTAAFTLIENNTSRIQKDVTSFRGSGGHISHHHFVYREDEAEWIADEISRNPNIETMVLARNNSCLSYVESELTSREIDYTKKGGSRYYSNITCNLFISTLYAIATSNVESISRTLDILFESANSKVSSDTIFKGAQYHGQMSKQQASCLNDISNAYQQNNSNRVNDAIRSLQAGLEGELTHLGYRYIDRLQPLSQYLCSMTGSLSQRLSSMSQNVSKDPTTILLTTIHSAKGLESERVFITCFSNRIIPSKNRGNSEVAHIEEERRLAFTAITRGKDQVFITSCDNSGSRKGWFGRSEFVYELGEIESTDHTIKKPRN